MPNPLFSTYRQGENRVTSPTLAVFERIDLALVRDLLSAATGSGDELEAVTFRTLAPEPGAKAIPDGRISARFTWWFETKTKRGEYGRESHSRDQMREYAKLLDTDTNRDALLFVLTPDPVRPIWLVEAKELGSVRERILWMSFSALAAAIEEVVRNPARLLGEQVRYLLSELSALYEADGLLSNDDTVIVAARVAWPEYNDYSAYICGSDRSFRLGLTHLGFYAEGKIQPRIARIRGWYPMVELSHEEAGRQRGAGNSDLADLMDQIIYAQAHHKAAYPPRIEGEPYGFMLLSGPDDGETVKLASPIMNDTVNAEGKNVAWTQYQRYTSLKSLRKPGITRTSQLAELVSYKVELSEREYATPPDSTTSLRSNVVTSFRGPPFRYVIRCASHPVGRSRPFAARSSVILSTRNDQSFRWAM